MAPAHERLHAHRFQRHRVHDRLVVERSNWPSAQRAAQAALQVQAVSGLGVHGRRVELGPVASLSLAR